MVDFLAFGFPFLGTLILSSIISSWLSPKFNVNGVIIFDKICGFVFGAFRGFLLILLFYLGFLYLIGKDKKLPDTLLESYSFKYINFSAELLVKFFNHKELKFDNDKAKELLDVNTTELQIGVSAQEVQSVVPEVIKTRKVPKSDEEILIVKYEKLIPLLIEAIKELSDKVDDLEQKLSDK